MSASAEPVVVAFPGEGLIGGLFDNSVKAAGDEFVKAVVGNFVVAMETSIRDLVGDFFTAATSPDVTAQEFVGPGGAYHAVASVSALLLVGFVVLGVIQGLFSGEPGQAFARILRDLPLSVLALIGFPWLVQQMVTVADVVGEIVLPADYGAEQLGGMLTVSPADDLAGFMVTSLAFFSCVLVFFELVVRDALVYVVTALAPLSFAAMTMPAARPAAAEAFKLTLAVVLSKPAIFIALRTGIDMLAHASAGHGLDHWGQYLSSVAITVIAAFMPFVVWKLLPLAERYALAQGLSRAPFRAAMQAAQLAYYGKGLAGGGRNGAASRGRGPGLPGGAPTSGGNGDSGGGGGGNSGGPAPGGLGGGGGGPGRRLPVPAGSRRRPPPRPGASSAPGPARGGPGSPPPPRPAGRDNRSGGGGGPGPDAVRRPAGQGWTRTRRPAAPGGAAAPDPDAHEP